MVEYVFASGLLGFALGYLGGKRNATPERPMRLTTIHAMTAPGLVAKPTTELEEWRLGLTSFAFHGNIVGFSYRQMAAAGIVRRAAWTAYTRLLKDSGVLTATEGSSTTWHGGWSYVKLRTALKHAQLSPPYPGGPAPKINSAWLAARSAHPYTPHTVNTGGGLYAGAV